MQNMGLTVLGKYWVIGRCQKFCNHNFWIHCSICADMWRHAKPWTPKLALGVNADTVSHFGTRYPTVTAPDVQRSAIGGHFQPEHKLWWQQWLPFHQHLAIIAGVSEHIFEVPTGSRFHLGHWLPENSLTHVKEPTSRWKMFDPIWCAQSFQLSVTYPWQIGFETLSRYFIQHYILNRFQGK